MYIGSLLQKQSGISFSYRYTVGHTEIPCLPEYKKEETEGERFGADGSLVGGTIGFDTFSFPGNCLDVHLDFNTSVFVDSVLLRLDCPCASAVEILSGDGKQALAAIRGENGEAIAKQKITLIADADGSAFIIRITADSRTAYADEEGVVHECRYLLIGGLEILGAVGMEEDLYPTPKSVVRHDGCCTDITGITAEGEDALFAAEVFAGKYAARTGNTLKVNGGNLRFALSDLPEEAYRVSVTKDGAEILGGSRRALLYAEEKLLQCVTEDGIRLTEIEDAPAFPFRGVHLALPFKKELPFLYRMVKYVFIPMGYNSVILELAGAMEYKSHPEINEKWVENAEIYERGEGPKPPHYGFVGIDIYSHEDMRKLCAFFRLWGLDVIPEVQTCSHVQYITAAHPELAEIDPAAKKETTDILKADEKPTPVFYHSMCPLHPDYYKIIFDLLDEVIAVTEPKEYVHIGHDEIYTIGKCPRCRDKGAAKIYADDLKIMHDHLAEKGLKTMIWSDMMEETGLYETAKGIADVPKDIVCLPFTWYFHLTGKDEPEKRLIENGFRYLTGNLYSSHFPRFRERTRNPAYLGGEVSTWVRCSELSYGYEGKVYDFLYSAEMLWNREYAQQQRRTQNRRLRKLLPFIRDGVHQDEVIRTEKTELTDGAVLSAGKDTPVTVKVGGRADFISVLHAADTPERRDPWQKPIPMGAYVFTYADGTEYSEPMYYGYQLCAYTRPFAQPLSSALFRHEGYIATYPSLPVTGKDANGADMTQYEYRVDNPHPEKEIISFRVVCDSPAVKVLVFGVKKENRT